MISSSRQRKRASKSSSKSQAASDAPRRARGPSYDVRAIEAKWRERWEASGLYHADLRAAKRPYYNLMMFPYPSAEGLHVGNMYSLHRLRHSRPLARGAGLRRLRADGLRRLRHPQRELCHQARHASACADRAQRAPLPRGATEAHRHALRLVARGQHDRPALLPLDAVDLHAALQGMGWPSAARRRSTGVRRTRPCWPTSRSSTDAASAATALVERRELEQWFLKITAYAEKLLDNLETLDWSERVKTAQRTWIGRSKGVEFAFRVADDADDEISRLHDTPRHDLRRHLRGRSRRSILPRWNWRRRRWQAQVAAYRAGAQSRRAALDEEEGRDVTGVFTGAYAIHPLTGERLPIWVADYVLAEYGTGAIMAAPAHDARDLAFAQAMGLPVREVVRPEAGSPPWDGNEAYTGRGVLVASGEFSGMPSDEAAWAVGERLEEMGVGQRRVNYHLRDWLISRQRYWGPPIPIIYCPTHGAVPVPDDQLPVLLPEVEDYVAQGDRRLAAGARFRNSSRRPARSAANRRGARRT